MTARADPAFLVRHFGLEGCVALVTGATGGIGRAIAAGLAAAGAAVVLSGRDGAALDAARRELEQAGGCVAAIDADLADVAACRRVVDSAVEAFGRLDVLVNCAGTNRRTPIAEVTPEEYDAIMAVNLRAAFFVSQAACRVMSANGGGRIINIGSLTCSIGLSDVSVYGASKAGLAQLTKTMAVEWATHNIQVNCLAPGFILTSLTEEALWGNDARRRWMLDRIPARRPGRPEDLVGLALLLASPASGYLTGQTITVDGGLLAGSPW